MMVIGLLIALFVWICQSAETRTYKMKDSAEQASEEEPIPFPGEFGEFFPGGNAKGSGENFGFPGEFNPDFIPYSESRNVTRYVNPAETYHAVKDMPGRGRDHQPRGYKDDGYRKDEPTYRSKEYRKDSYRPQDDSYSNKDKSYRRDDPHRKGGGGGSRGGGDNYKRSESHRKGDGYRKDGGYRKSDSYHKEESYRKDEPRHRGGGDRDYHKEHSGHRKHESYRRDGDRPAYRKEESSYHKQAPSYRKEESSYNKEHREDNYRKKPIQNLYDDWSPEDDRPIYHDREERIDPESDIEDDEGSDYHDREDEPPHYKERDSRKSMPASLRPGPPYYTPDFKNIASGAKGRNSNSGSRSQLTSPTPTPQTYYAPSIKSSEQPKLQHRKGEAGSSKHSQHEKEWTDFRPSPPDPIQPSSRSRSREDYPEGEYSSSVPKKAKVATTPLPINRQNCVKLKKTENPPNSSGKYSSSMMTCYVCVDEKTGTNYEQCSYESDAKTKPYVKTTEEEEASHTKVNHREKRSTSTKERIKREKDYYEQSKEKPYKYETDSFEEREDFSDVSGKGEDEGSADYDSDDCYKKKKGDMSCIVCESPNKQGSYEQCSYESEPKKNKYEHSVEKVYGSPRLPETDSSYNKKGSSYAGSDYDSSLEIPKLDYSPTDDYEPPSSRSKSKSNKKILGGSSFDFGLDSFDFGDLESRSKSSKGFDFGDSFDFDSIPEPAENEGTFSERVDTFSFKSDEMGDIDMSKNIGNFDQKNRSDCKKVIKNKMTCYQCVGGKGAKQEECMYVAAAEPEKKHLSFSQVEEYKSDPRNSSAMKMEYPPVVYGKRKFKKYHPDLTDMKFFNRLKEKATIEASRWPRSPNSTVQVKEGKKDLDGAASDQEYKEEDDEEDGKEDRSDEEGSEESEETVSEDYNSVPSDPPEIDYKEAEKGEYHKDTESAWDPKLGISLPRYMLDKSEHEAIFDEVLASG